MNTTSLLPGLEEKEVRVFDLHSLAELIESVRRWNVPFSLDTRGRKDG